MNVFNMPSGVPFLRSLARGLRDHYGDDLARGLILVPTRRSANALARAFVEEAGTDGALMLPRLRPLADVNPDEPPFEPGELAGRVRPAIDPVQRRFEIAKLVEGYHDRIGDTPLDPATALRMADPLIEIMDDAALEEAQIRDSEEWRAVCDQASEHFRHAGTLYQIIEEFWPQRLTEIGLSEPADRRVELLDALGAMWTERPPDYPVVVAGSTGTLRATARLMRVVAGLKTGMVVLPGLQTGLPKKIWDNIDDRHPQASLKNLLDVMELSRGDVRPWPWITYAEGEDADAAARGKVRRKVIAEALVPVDSTGDWLRRIDVIRKDDGADVFENALEALSLIEADTDAEEALAIALIMREALNTDGRTAALVTPDQSLAQRVHTRLQRWDISVAMSQGQPVEQQPIGVFLSHILRLAPDPTDPIALNLVLTHPLCGLGLPSGVARKEWRALEYKKFRGLRPKDEVVADYDIIRALHDRLVPLLGIAGSATPDVWAAALVATAEALAATDDRLGAFRLWDGDAGTQAVTLLDGIALHGAALPNCDVNGFADMLSETLRGAVVRPSRGTHPRLSILGPLEARLLDVDVVIMGGLNEGTWPGSVDSGPFLSRNMRRKLGMSLPERRYGLAAHDFAELAASPSVFLTRSKRDASGPTVASRWVWRLKTLLRGAMEDEAVEALLGTGQQYLDWARAMDRPDALTFIERPNPKPPVSARWRGQTNRKISITGAARWIRDPYSIYAAEILRLKVLDPLDAPLDARHFGTAIHEGIEHFVDAKGDHTDPERTEELVDRLLSALSKAGYAPEDLTRERTRLERIAEELIAWFGSRRDEGWEVIGTEIRADYQVPDKDFRITGYLDFVERGIDGYAFSDFKTGSPPSAKEVNAGFDLQLALAGWLAREGGLNHDDKDGKPKRGERLRTGPTAAMGYVRTSGTGDGVDYSERVLAGKADGAAAPKDADELIDQAAEIIRRLIDRFDREETGFPSQPRAKFVNKYGDYDDLARRSEWSDMIGGDE